MLLIYPERHSDLQTGVFKFEPDIKFSYYNKIFNQMLFLPYDVGFESGGTHLLFRVPVDGVLGSIPNYCGSRIFEYFYSGVTPA